MEPTINLNQVRGFEEEKTKGVSPWMLALQEELGAERPAASWSYTVQDFLFDVIEGDQSLWIVIHFPKGGEVALRAAYCPYNYITINEMKALDDGVEHGLEKGLDIHLTSVTGDYRVCLELPSPE